MKDTQSILDRYTKCFDWEYDWAQESDKSLIRPCLTEPNRLAEVYSRIHGKFPALYERLLLSYRWFRADLQKYSLLANPPGIGFDGLIAEIFSDANLSMICLAENYVQFGFSCESYDPICFDLNNFRRKDCPIVRLDHEEILCKERCRVKQILAPTFEELINRTVESKL